MNPAFRRHTYYVFALMAQLEPGISHLSRFVSPRLHLVRLGTRYNSILITRPQSSVDCSAHLECFECKLVAGKR